MKKLLTLVVILGLTHFLLLGSGIGNNRNKTTNLGQSTSLSLKMSQCVNTTSSITETVCSSYIAPDGVVYTTSGVKTAIIPNAGGCDSIITINLTIDQPPVISGSISATTVMSCTPPGAVTSVASLEGMGLVISDDYTLNANLMVTSNDVSSGSCPTTITRTYTIKDGCNHQSTTIHTIYLADNIAPSITGTISTSNAIGCSIADKPIAANSVAALESMGLEISDNCTADANITVSSSDVSSGTCPITVTRVYTITDGCNNSGTVLHTIYIGDIIPPTVSAQAPISVQCATLVPAVNTAAVTNASDNCGTPLISFVSEVSNGAICPEIITRTYQIADACDNSINVIQTITIHDTISPTITFYPTTQTFCNSLTGIYPIPQIAAMDNCVAPLSYSYSISGTTSRSGVGKDASGTFNDGASTITWTVTDGCGNISTATTNVTINSTATSTTNTTICPAESPYFWNGLVCGTAGTYVATLVSSKGCDSLATLNLTVNPTVTSTTNIAICSGLLPYTWNGLTFPAAGSQTSTLVSSKGCDSLATLNLTVNSTVTSTTNRTICATELPIIWNGLACGTAGSYIATLVSSKGCDSLATLNLTVTPAITPLFTILDSICTGATSPILPTISNNGITGTWSPSVVSNTTTGSYTFTPTTGQCASNTPITVVVRVNQVPSAASMNVHSNSPVCIGATLNLYANGGSDYEWSGPVPYAVTFQNPVRPNATVAMSGDYYVTITTAAGCSSTATLNVTVNPLPTATASNNGPICSGGTLNLTSGGGTGYSWSGPNGYTSILQNPTISTVTAANAGIYQVTVTGAGGCTSTAQTTVVINALPIATAVDNGPLCAGETLNLTSSGGTGYSWIGPNGFTSILQNPTITNITTANSGTYTVTVTNAAGCTSTAQFGVSISAKPTPTISGDTMICHGESTTLTANGGATYVWGSTAGESIIVSPNTTTVYQVVATSAQGCTQSTSVSVGVGNSPMLSITNTTNDHCSMGIGTATVVATGGSGNYIYQWNTSPVQNTPNATGLSAGSYSLTVSDEYCSNSIQLSIGNIESSSSTADVSICMGESYVFNGHTYATAGNYIDTLQTIHGCDSIVTTHLTVHDPASVHGTVVYSGGYISSGDAMVILYQTGANGHHQLVDSAMIGANGTFSLLNIPSGDYYLYVKLLNHSAYQHVHNSYFDSTYQWQEAAILNVNCATDTNITIHMVETGPANPGNGHITGTIQQYTNNKTIGDPLPGVEIYVRTESNNEPVANCASKSNGIYDFTKIPNGSYSIYVDIPGIPMIQTYTGINVTASDTLFGNLNFYVDTTTLSAGIYTDEILSVNKIETPELSVNIFPNPVKNELSIEVSNQTEGLSIEVLDINGKSLYKSTTGNRAKIEMNAFATGVYLIKIQSKNTVIFKKIVKE